MAKEKNGKNLIIIALFFIVVCMSVGFAFLSTTLNINGNVLGAKKSERAENIIGLLDGYFRQNGSQVEINIIDKKIILQGVADSSAIVEKAIVLAQKEVTDYKVESTISVVQDFKIIRHYDPSTITIHQIDCKRNTYLLCVFLQSILHCIVKSFHDKFLRIYLYRRR